MDKDKFVKTITEGLDYEQQSHHLNADRLMRIEAKLDQLLPQIKDMTELLKEARESHSKVQPNNHKRKGTGPRSREGCFKKRKQEIKYHC